MKQKDGITLVALIITIIVLLIIAGVGISIALGQNGLLNNAKFAQEKYENEKEKESIALANYESEITGDRDTVTISKEEYEELKNKVNRIGEIYTKANTVNIANYRTWTEVKNATWTLPEGTWVINFSFQDAQTGTGIWTLELNGMGLVDTIWRTANDHGKTNFTWVKTFSQETTGYLKYYQGLSSTSRNIYFTMYAVRIK